MMNASDAHQYRHCCDPSALCRPSHKSARSSQFWRDPGSSDRTTQNDGRRTAFRLIADGNPSVAQSLEHLAEIYGKDDFWSYLGTALLTDGSRIGGWVSRMTSAGKLR